MREIKFRALDKEEKKIYDNVVGIYFYPGCTNVTIQDEGGFNDIFDVELIQYTGLKDKNGKEIFAKDIIECLTNEGLERYIVDWLGGLGAWGLFPVGPISKGEFLYSTGADVLEIIGNKYEHPELIEGQGGR